MKNKKASHVGVILSFVIFITFLIFLFSIFGSPFKLSINKEPLIDYLETELINKYSLNLTVLTISPITDKNCIQINYNLLDLNELKELDSIVKDKDGKIVNSKTSNNKLTIKRGGENFFKIYYAKGTLDNSNYDSGVPGNCQKTLEVNEINSIRINKYFTKKKIDNFFDNYEKDYEHMKDELNLPPNAEFGLSFKYADGTIKETPPRDIITDIFSREIPIQYFDSSATIRSGFINIRVW